MRNRLLRVAPLVRLCAGLAIVTHGEVVRLLTVDFLSAPLEHLFRVRARNGTVTIFDGDSATFEYSNRTIHLVGLAPKDLMDYVAGTQ